MKLWTSSSVTSEKLRRVKRSRPFRGILNLDPTIGATVRERVEAEVPLPRVLMAYRVPPYTDAGFYAADIAGVRARDRARVTLVPFAGA